MAFSGFTTDALVGLPPELFTEVLPQITLASELKVTLHVFYRLSRQRGAPPRRLRWEDLCDDKLLRRGMLAVSRVRGHEDLLAEGLEAALGRGSLLHLVSPDDGRAVNWYLANTAANREWVVRAAQAGATLAPLVPMADERPQLVALYEQNIGLITPLLLEELREAEERFPAFWIEDAMREAVRANARSWRYIKKVLERWAAHGRRDASDQPQRPIDIDKYTSGTYGDLFRRGSDTSDL